jgi:hypothetical protein
MPNLKSKKYIQVFAFTLFICILNIFNVNYAYANVGINTQIPYSGNIIKNDGTVLDGTYKAKLLIYDVPTGGVALYEEIWNGSNGESNTFRVNDGRFEVVVGAQNPTNFLNSINKDTLYLELQLDIDNDPSGIYEETFAPRRRIASAVSAINSLRLVSNNGSNVNTLSLDAGGNVTATALGGSANNTTPGGFDRVLLANSSGQFSQTSLTSLNTLLGGGIVKWEINGNATTDAWNGSSGAFLGTVSFGALIPQPLVLATANSTPQDIRFFTGVNGANERMRITGAGNVIVNSLGGVSNTTTPGGFDRVLLANSSGQFNQVGISSLGSGIWASQSDFNNLQSEIVEARGDRTNLDLRISTISNFASPNAGGNIIGQYYDNAFQATVSASLAGAVNRIDLAPFYTSQRLRIDQIGIGVVTAVAGSLAKVVIYSSDSNGWPDQLLFEGSSDLDCSTTGYKFHSLDFTFDSGRQYWLGVRFNSTQSIRSLALASAVNLGVNGSSGNTYFSTLRRTITYSNSAPSNWNFVTGDRAANVTPPSIRMRAAALP